MNNHSMTAGQALVRLLANYGVETVFGIPGVHTLELYRGLPGSGIRHVLTRHEQGAGFMADGYARVSGKPGVALVITGPGLTNTITAMAQARQDSIPMLVISGVNRRVTGLRREEVALLAGISVEYDIRLERGRVEANDLDIARGRRHQARSSWEITSPFASSL